jgi:formate dehydrogenase alpha subunit
MIKENGKHREASWDEATKLVAEKLNKIKGDSGPDSIGVLTSARITTEELYLAQKLARETIGTNNIDHQLSQSSTVEGLAAAVGSGAMTNPIEDIEKSDVILIAGSNTTENHPVLSSYVKRAVTFKGAKLIVADPRKIKITRFSNIWMRQNPGTDVAWINGMINVIIKEKLYDESYVNGRTAGLAELQSSVDKFTPEYVEEATGIPKEQVVEAAQMYAQGKVSSIICGMGMTQRNGGSECVKSLANLAMICGNIGVEGGGINPLRGQNNAQGASDMGCVPDMLPGNKKVDASSAGLSYTGMLEKAREGALKAMYIIGDNPAGSGSVQTKESLEKLDFLVVQDMFMTETAQLADVVLPSASFAEKDGTFVNTERRVQLVRKAIDSPGDAKEDWRILCDVSKAMGTNMDCESAQSIMQEIVRVVPAYAGINYDRLEEKGMQCPSTADGSETARLHVDKFICGKGKLQTVDYTPPEIAPDAQYPMYLTTGRNLFQFHTSSDESKAALGLSSEPFAEISIEDAVACQVGDGDSVKVASKNGEVQLKVVVSDKTMKGSVFVPHPFAAPLDPAAETLEHKVCIVKIEKA